MRLGKATMTVKLRRHARPWENQKWLLNLAEALQQVQLRRNEPYLSGALIRVSDCPVPRVLCVCRVGTGCGAVQTARIDNGDI